LSTIGRNDSIRPSTRAKGFFCCGGGSRVPASSLRRRPPTQLRLPNTQNPSGFWTYCHANAIYL
jgi:hypothetical protein